MEKEDDNHPPNKNSDMVVDKSATLNTDYGTNSVPKITEILSPVKKLEMQRPFQHLRAEPSLEDMNYERKNSIDNEATLRFPAHRIAA